MSAESLALIAGAVLSLLFSYIPGLNARFAGLGAEVKRLIMLALLVVVAGTVYGLACAGYAPALGVDVACTQEGLIGLISALAIAVIANQSTYAISPKTTAVQEARAE